MTISESPSSSKSALLCMSGSLSLFSDFCFVFFFSVHFCTTVRCVRSEQKEDAQIIIEIINDKSMHHRKVYSKCYVVNDNRLGCFVFEKQTRKITAKLHKVTPVQSFIYCLISSHTKLI